MTYRSMLVYLDNDPLCDLRTRLSIEFAKERDCHLVGLAPTGLVELPAFTAAASSLADYAAMAWDTLRDTAEEVTQRFRDACRAAGVKSFEALTDEADKASSLVRHAHCSDIVLVSQAVPQSAGYRAAEDMVESVVLHSARPTLIVPHAGRFEHFGKNVLVAWDDSREAARALADALPLLVHAKRVQLVSWNESGAGDDKTLRPRLEAVHRWLMWHGVPAEIRVETTDIGIADAMLSRAADLGVDLMVMGAYGHARWTERMLGGATRGLLASMTVPVLMSH
jgi:nucleotide-binding universal stress UspA family protein